MITLHDKPASELYSAHHSFRPISFHCEAPRAQSVQITGDFDHWFRVPMQRQRDGCRYVQVLLCHGHYQHQFLVDGKPRLDPAVMGFDRNGRGEPVSLTAVS
jgi:1,4-alpha-glucan branching enzyme